MPTLADVRKFALALDDVSEADHWGRPAFRTRKRIFVVVWPKEKRANILLPEERKEFLFEAAPEIFAKLMWGKRAYLLADLTKIGRRDLEALIREAWTQAATAPKAKNRGRTRTRAAAR
jgi:hypothetical protein